MTNVRGMTLGSRVGLGSANAGPTVANVANNASGVNSGGVSISAARSELGEVATGRFTLATINFIILAFIGLYLWTRSAQGGG